MYEALKRAQESRPPADTITIVPLPSARVPGHTWEPDFLVAYRGRVGAIEVDGPHHTGKRAAELCATGCFAIRGHSGSRPFGGQASPLIMHR